MKDPRSTQKNSEKSFPFATIFKHVVCRHICGRLVSHIIGLGPHSTIRIVFSLIGRYAQPSQELVRGRHHGSYLKFRFTSKSKGIIFFKFKVCKTIVLKTFCYFLLVRVLHKKVGIALIFFLEKALTQFFTYITSYLVNTVIQRTSEKNDTQEISI